MKKFQFKSACSRFFVIFFVCCTTLLQGCNILDDSDELDNLENSAKLTPTVSTIDSSETQQSDSDKYNSSSIIGAMQKSEMKSEKYTLTARLAFPNQTFNK
jgi:hypothetical protein